MVTDYKIGYSPERINPGDKEHTISTIVKVVSGCCAESLETIARVYELVVKAGYTALLPSKWPKLPRSSKIPSATSILP